MRIFNLCTRIPVYTLEKKWKEVHFFPLLTKNWRLGYRVKRQNNLIRSVYLMCDVVFRKLIEHVISQPLYNRLAGFSSAARAILWLNAKDCIQARLGQVTLVSVNTREILVSVFSTALFIFFFSRMHRKRNYNLTCKGAKFFFTISSLDFPTIVAVWWIKNTKRLFKELEIFFCLNNSKKWKSRGSKVENNDIFLPWTIY